jgi:hypothetical protein
MSICLELNSKVALTRNLAPASVTSAQRYGRSAPTRSPVRLQRRIGSVCALTARV